MNASIAIAGIIAGTVSKLAFIAAGYGGFRLIAPRFQIAAPKAPQPKREAEPEAKAPAADDEEPRSILLGRAASC